MQAPDGACYKQAVTYSGATVDLGDHLYSWATCQGNCTGAYQGDQAPDCTKLVSTCGGYADKTGEKGMETLEFSAVAGETWYVVVDGPTSVGGSFSVEVVGL